jgi:two-component system, NarL family, nitrate/nitrite response regulator NarL
MDSPIRVLIFHKTRFLGDALRLLLGGWKRLDIFVTHDSKEARSLIEQRFADVVLLYIPGGSAGVVREIKLWQPQQRVVVLGLDDRVEEILRMIEAGAAGYLLQDAGPDDIALMIEAVFEERPICSPRVVAAIIDRLWELARTAPPPLSVADKLSSREQQILEMIREGLANKEIARSLDIELCTVKNHVHRILEKLNVRSRREAVRLAVKNDIAQTGRIAWSQPAVNPL